MEKVVIAAAKNYSDEVIERAVGQIFNSLPLAIKPGMRITVKPNLLMKRRPEEATTTHPEVVKAVIRQLQNRGVQDITIADSPGGPYTKALLHGIYQVSGMEQVAQQTGVQLNYNIGFTEVPAPNAVRCRSFSVIDPVCRADMVISVGKVKTHCMTTLSGGVKNLFGCVPGLQKPELHYRFQNREEFGEMLVDLAQCVAPALTIMDGVVSMEGDGPSAGTPVKTGFLCGSTDPFALDMFLCGLLGIAPKSVPTTASAIERGLCPRQPDEVPVLRLGDAPTCLHLAQPSSHSVDFMSRVPRPFRYVVGFVKDWVLTPHPAVDKGKCIGCGRCAQSCPAQIIKIVEGRAKIPQKGCIHCYCCHEMCPVKAIYVRRAALFNL